MERDEVVLGKRYKDRISGIVGIACGVHDYLNGCQRVSIHPAAVEGKAPDGVIIDVQDAIYVDGGIFEEVVKKPTGGPSRFDPKVTR